MPAADMSTDPEHVALQAQQAQQKRDNATLVLSGLDSSVITSPTIVKALTEPFGHLEALFHSDQQHDGPHGRAMIVYCCSSSASLARLALHGLVIGKSRVQASLAVPTSTAADDVYDTGTSDAAALSAYLHGSPHDPALGIVSSQPHEHPTARMTPRQINAASRYPGLAEAGSPPLTQQHSTRGCGAHPDPWRNHDSSSEAAIKHIPEDLVLNERVSVSHPSPRGPTSPLARTSVDQGVNLTAASDTDLNPTQFTAQPSSSHRRRASESSQQEMILLAPCLGLG